MPYSRGKRLAGESASKLGHLDVLKSPLVQELCRTFEDPSSAKQSLPCKWRPMVKSAGPLPFVFGVDGSIQIIESRTKPFRALGFVKTAMVMLDQPALSVVDKAEPHPFTIRDILEKSQLYHATVFPLRYVHISGQSIYDTIRTIIFDSLRDPSLEGQVFETLKWLAYEKWDGAKKPLPKFQCPHCFLDEASLPYDADKGTCPKCGKEIFLSDMLGFHQVMTDESAPDNVASDYMSIHETLLLFTGIRYYWHTSKDVLSKCLFIKDGPLSIRAQYSKLVNPIRRFLTTAKSQQVEVYILGQEKSGAFWDHLELIGDSAPPAAIFVPDHNYIREHIQHRPISGAKYGKDTNYGAKVFLKLNERHKFVLNIPNGSMIDPQDAELIGSAKILATIESLLSARYENALLPVELAHSVASLSTYPSAKVLAMFAEASKIK